MAQDTGFRTGQRVMTIDNLPGRILFVSASFAPGVTEYEVVLDHGMGQGIYTASQLRPVPDDYRTPGHLPHELLPAGITAAIGAEAAGTHLASDDYPEMGSVLHDRPDPGQQITVVGLRRTAANDHGRLRTAAGTYGRPDDVRDEDYNGGPGDLGMYWAEPAQQEWVHDNLGPQEEAPPPAYMPPALARLAEIEEAASLIGDPQRHFATSINGTQIDEHGDAPQHGTVPRAAGPDAYDEQSTEGDGDPKWSDPVDPEHKKIYNGSQVGMYPEGISAGGGPGLEIGPFVASRVPWTGAERGELHGWDNGAAASWGDFVPSTSFTNRQPLIDDIEPPEVEAEERHARTASQADDYWAAHLRQQHGYSGEAISRIRARGERIADLHQGIHDAGLANHHHDPGERRDLLPFSPHEHDDEHEGAPADPAASLAASEPAQVYNPARWSPETQRRRYSALAAFQDKVTDSLAEPAPHEHDDSAGSLDAGGDLEPPGGQPGDSSAGNSPGQDPGGYGDGLPPMAWPVAGAPITKGGPALTQGSGDGRQEHKGPNVIPGQAPPGQQPGGEPPGADEDAADEDAEDGESKKKISLEISAHLAAFTAAAASRPFRFEFTAAWKDIVAKAKRIRREGRVRITHASAGMVIGAVSGDHGIYESGIQRPPHKPQAIQHWACGCPWGSFRQDKSLPARYAGRPCSHVMALQFEAQAQTIHGRELAAGPAAPGAEVVVKSMPPWTPPTWSRTLLAPSASLCKTAEMFCPACGDDRDASGRCYGCGVVSHDPREGILHTATPDEARDWDWTPEERGEWERGHGPGAECLYRHAGPCPPVEDLSRTAESASHSRPGDFRSEITPNPLHDPHNGYVPIAMASHVLTGYVGGKLAGRLHFSASDDGQAYEVHMLHSRMPGQGVASAMMDDLYSHVKHNGRWLDHGERTGQGNSWWAKYREPYPEVSTHHTHPGEGWMSYWSPLRVAQDAASNYAGSGGRGAHTQLAWRPGDFPHDDRNEMWTRARGLQPPAQRATAALLANGEDLGEVLALAQLAGVKRDAIRYTADQASGPWGSENVSKHPPAKPYGATEPPNKDMSPASYGFLAGPDPANWGEIQEGSFVQSPLTTSASQGHMVLAPGAPGPLPPSLNYPDVGDFHENQGSFAYTDRAGTAGPSTAIEPHDPGGIRMEEARHTAATHDECENCGKDILLDPVYAGGRWIHTHNASECCTTAGGPKAKPKHRGGTLAELRDEPEPALPSTTGDDLEATGAIEPSPVTQNPGPGSLDEYFTPDDQSIQTIGNQQWSGGGADSDETDVPAGEPHGSADEVIAAFQRSAAARHLIGGGSPAGTPAGGDITAAARQFLKTADALPDHEAAELIGEGRGVRARNLGLLRLEGTHYEDADEDLARRGLCLDDFGDDVIAV